ncbi:MAG TPA: hypothetical protein VGU65_10925 [Frateuria sp.]|uniref:hypothetical protein n=1 Tax=Frateuria sp. TaxID=2211372 RepID=UPI002DEC58E9|nr:hypothetical protein [Frateuria sp.]
MISQSYQYPLHGPHSTFVERLLRLGRQLGLLAFPAEATAMSRRHRMMFTMDEHRRHRRPAASGDDLVPPAAAAVSQPTQFGPLCFAVATLGPEAFPVAPGESARDVRIDGRLRLERAHLALDLQYRERVRSCRLNDRDATHRVQDRKRQIRLLDELRHP